MGVCVHESALFASLRQQVCKRDRQTVCQCARAAYAKQLRSHDHRVAVDFGSSCRAVVVVIVAAVVAINSYALFASSRRVASFQVRAALRILIRRHLRCVARRLLVK